MRECPVQCKHIIEGQYPESMQELERANGLENFDFWVFGFIQNQNYPKPPFFAKSVLAKCGLPILFACQQVWSGDNNSEPRWQTNIGGSRHIKLARWKEDSTTAVPPTQMSSPARQQQPVHVHQTGGAYLLWDEEERRPQASNAAAASQSYPLHPGCQSQSKQFFL